MSFAKVIHRLMTLSVIAVVLALPEASHARLGETAQACVERYGQPFKVERHNLLLGVEGEPYMDFNMSGIHGVNVRCFFPVAEPIAICDLIHYSNIGPVGSDEIIARLLMVESQGFVWGPAAEHMSPLGDADNEFAYKEWQRSDGATAVYTRSLDLLQITSKQRLDAERQETESYKRNKIKGL